MSHRLRYLSREQWIMVLLAGGIPCLLSVICGGALLLMSQLLFDEANFESSRGLDYFENEQYQDAIDAYDRAIELEPEDADAYFNRGRAYAELGNHLVALEDYDRALELDYAFGDIYYYRGVTLVALGELEAATEDFDIYIEIGGDPLEVDAALGRLDATEEPTPPDGD